MNRLVLVSALSIFASGLLVSSDQASAQDPQADVFKFCSAWQQDSMQLLKLQNYDQIDAQWAAVHQSCQADKRARSLDIQTGVSAIVYGIPMTGNGNGNYSDTSSSSVCSYDSNVGALSYSGAFNLKPFIDAAPAIAQACVQALKAVASRKTGIYTWSQDDAFDRVTLFAMYQRVNGDGSPDSVTATIGIQPKGALQCAWPKGSQGKLKLEPGVERAVTCERDPKGSDATVIVAGGRVNTVPSSALVVRQLRAPKPVKECAPTAVATQSAPLSAEKTLPDVALPCNASYQLRPHQDCQMEGNGSISHQSSSFLAKMQLRGGKPEDPAHVCGGTVTIRGANNNGAYLRDTYASPDEGWCQTIMVPAGARVAVSMSFPESQFCRTNSVGFDYRIIDSKTAQKAPLLNGH